MRGEGRSGGRGSGGGRHSGSGGGAGGGYRNPCLTMHQPWASLLVAGIKRVEGRSWPSPVTGRLWIHAAGKVPDPDTVAAMEAFYREIHAVDGVAAIEFPQHYPVSRLLGCVDVVGCVRSEELVCWEDVPESVRLEGLTDFCWLCENPQKLVVPFEMRGYQGVYNLERRIYEGAVRGLSPVQGPLPVKFPLPDPRNPFSLKPGSLNFDSSKSAQVKTPSVSAAIAGARAAANQYTRKDNNAAATSGEIQTPNKSRENRVDGSSVSGSLPSVVQKRASHLQRLNPSPVVQSTPSYSRNMNPPSFILNSPPHLQIQNHSAAATSSEIQTRNKSREYRADGSSGSGSLPLIVHDSASHSQRLNPSPVVQKTPSYSQNQNPPSIIVNSPPHLQIQNHSASATSSEIQTRNKSREERAGSGSGSGSLPSAVQGSPSHSQCQNPLSTVQNIPSYTQDQNPVSIVGSIPIYLQSQNPPSIVHAIPSYPHNQIPVSIVGSIPIYLQDHSPSLAAQNNPSVLQYQNPEPRRSPRLQSGASSRLVAVALRELKQSSSSEGRVRWVPKSRPE